MIKDKWKKTKCRY